MEWEWREVKMVAEGKCAEGRLIAPNPVDWVATEESMVEAAGVEPKLPTKAKGLPDSKRDRAQGMQRITER